MSKTIFYSWQSDLPNNSNRSFIEKSIKKAISLSEELSIYMNYDRDTLGVNGSPDISHTIFEKIEQSSLFICDISIINNESTERKLPNPNVLIELGYAIGVLGWEKIICIMNEDYGSVSLLPFDLRQHRIVTYSGRESKDKDRLANIIQKNINELFVSGKLYNPISDYMKGKIDKDFLDIAKKIANIVFGTITMSDGLAGVSNLLKLNQKEIQEKIINKKIPLFLLLSDYETTDLELHKILDNLFSSNYFPKKWINVVLKLIDWIRCYRNLISPRFNPNLLTILDDEILNQYKIISAHEINNDNPKNSKIILKMANGKKYGEVVNTTEYSGPYSSLNKLCIINEESLEKISNLFINFIATFNEWANDEDSEIILDPNIYYVK